MPGRRLGERRHCRRTHRSELPCTDLWLGSYRCTTAVTEIGTKSFHLAQRVIDTETQEIKCTCTSVMVTFDLEKHESKPLEEEWIQAICKYEGRDLRKKK